MWNPFQLEGTGEQSHCLETQLSVLGLFSPSGPHSVEDTNLHHTTPRECTRRSKKDHHVLNSLASSDLLPSARGIWGPKTKQRWRNAVFLPQIIRRRKFCLLRGGAWGHQGCLGGMFVCRVTKCKKQRHAALVCELEAANYAKCFQTRAQFEIPKWQQINSSSRTVCSAAERGAKPTWEIWRTAPLDFLQNPPIHVQYPLCLEVDKILRKNLLWAALAAITNVVYLGGIHSTLRKLTRTQKTQSESWMWCEKMFEKNKCGGLWLLHPNKNKASQCWCLLNSHTSAMHTCKQYISPIQDGSFISHFHNVQVQVLQSVLHQLRLEENHRRTQNSIAISIELKID